MPFFARFGQSTTTKNSPSFLKLFFGFLALNFVQINLAMAKSTAAKIHNKADSAASIFPSSALLELANALLGGSSKEVEGEGNGQQKQQSKGPIQRRSKFFGENDPSNADGLDTASFSRQPKTREQQEAELEDELRAEFVRISLKNDPDGNSVRFRKKTYTTMPRPFECYSCMSSSYQTKWAFLKEMYFAPKAFTDACDQPIQRRSQIPSVLCASFCVSMLEPSVEAGLFVGFKYIRGCGDRILRHGFNQTALQIHRFAQVDKCRQLPRAHLFNQPRQLEVAVTGNLQLCTCYGERCNGEASGGKGTAFKSATAAIWICWILALILAFFPLQILSRHSSIYSF